MQHVASSVRSNVRFQRTQLDTLGKLKLRGEGLRLPLSPFHPEKTKVQTKELTKVQTKEQTN